MLGHVDPHDILQQNRWRRRKRKDKKGEKRKSYVKGKVINGQHELYTLSIAVMLGVRTSIGTTNSRMSAANGRHWLTSDDFMATEKYEFSPKVRYNIMEFKCNRTERRVQLTPILTNFTGRSQNTSPSASSHFQV